MIVTRPVDTSTRPSSQPRTTTSHAPSPATATAKTAGTSTKIAASAFAAFTGLQWRQLRELGGTISELKQEQKPLPAQVEAAGEEGPPGGVELEECD